MCFEAIIPDILMWLAHATWRSRVVALSGVVFDTGPHWLPSYQASSQVALMSPTHGKAICGNAEEAVEMVLRTGDLLPLKTAQHLGLGTFLGVPDNPQGLILLVCQFCCFSNFKCGHIHYINETSGALPLC